MLKKILSILLAVLLIGFAPITSAYADEFDEDNNVALEDFEELSICQATLEDDFEDNSVIVVMKRDYGGINKVYENNYFGNAFYKIQDNFYIEEDIEEKNLANIEDFRQILQLFLVNPGKENVLIAIKELEKRDDILSAEPDYIRQYESCAITIPPNDTEYIKQWNLPHISAPAAWDDTQGDRSVKVGVLDSGVFSHTDLNANVTTGYSVPLGHANFDDSTGARFGHGTYVAGVIGAIGNNATGITGVCWNVTIVPIKLESFGTGGVSIVQALKYAIENEIFIINMSFKYDGFDTVDYNAIRNYGAWGGLVVAGAGNDAKDNDGNNPAYPASYNLPNVISVGATGAGSNSDRFAKPTDWGWQPGDPHGSNYGATTVDLFAPGTSILSTSSEAKCNLPVISGNRPCEYVDNNISASGLRNGTTHVAPGYHNVRGTSFAAPHVTGVAALMKSINPTLTAAQIKSLILRKVDKGADLNPNNDLVGKCVTNGRLNASKAVKAAKPKYTVTYLGKLQLFLLEHGLEQ